ncbi:MAG: riboflavin kinase, partial [Clostridia bacterium]
MSELSFTLHGQVIRGKRLGSKLGFPTANIAYARDDRSWPREGVYIGVAEVEGIKRSYLAILNQGSHPTAPEGVPTVEAHLLGYPNHALYGQCLTLTYRAFLRPEQTFASLEQLKEQLSEDRRSALLWARLHEPALLAQSDELSPTEQARSTPEAMQSKQPVSLDSPMRIENVSY